LMHLVLDFYANHDGEIERFDMPPSTALEAPEQRLIEFIASHHDREHGGFQQGHKFPPHCTLLFLLHHFDLSRDEVTRSIAERTLDAMAVRGLHDHLQGGFFRYCVDREWTIPHFEKMLYDQAMTLWVYSAAFKVLGKKEYRTVARMIVKCLSETFEQDGLFYSAHDADTNGEEGATYLWAMDELNQNLNPEELARFEEAYQVTEAGNFEGRNHLIKRRHGFLPDIEQKLLEVRRKRPQPFADRKFVTGWNALAGIGLLMADRLAGIAEGKVLANRVFDRLIERHYVDGRLIHSSLGADRQGEEFLNDNASMLLLATFLHEETGQYTDVLNSLHQKLEDFKGEDGWLEARNEDFMPVPAQQFDHPTPSSDSLAELAILRMKIMTGQEYMPVGYRQPLACDFYNIAAMIADGAFHVVHAPEPLSWDRLPLNCIQVRSKRINDCFRGKCQEFETVEALVDSIGR